MTTRRLVAAGWLRCQRHTHQTAAQIRADLRAKKPGSEGQK